MSDLQRVGVADRLVLAWRRVVCWWRGHDDVVMRAEESEIEVEVGSAAPPAPRPGHVLFETGEYTVPSRLKRTETTTLCRRCLRANRSIAERPGGDRVRVVQWASIAVSGRVIVPPEMIYGRTNED